MRAFSSHRGRLDSKMRFLIVCTAIAACVSAAPSHILPLSALPLPAVAYSSALPTISSGDIQGAAIDAQVKYNDWAQSTVDQVRAINDQARAINDQTIENWNIKAYSNIDTANEKVADALWNIEDKKWQALGAIQTAEAQLDGAIASNSPALAKGAIGSPLVAAVAPYSAVAPIAPVSPLVYSGFAAPAVKAIADAAVVQAAKIESDQALAAHQSAEAAVKSAEVAVKSAEAEKIEAEKLEKATELKAAEAEANKAFAVFKSSIVTPSLAVANGYLASGVYPTVNWAQPVLKYASPLHPIAPGFAPTLIKSVW